MIGTSSAIRLRIDVVVRPVELVGLARLLVGVAHPPHHPALLGTPVDARREVEDHRQPRRREVGVVLGDDDLVAGPAGEDPGPGRLADGGQRRPSGEHHAWRADRASTRSRTPVDGAVGDGQALKLVRSKTSTPAVNSAAV